MTIATILNMAASAFPDRSAITSYGKDFSYADLQSLSVSGAKDLLDAGSTHLVYVGTNDVAFAVAVFAAAIAGVPIVPINYRLGDIQIRGALSGLDRPFVLVDSVSMPRVAALGYKVHARDSWVAESRKTATVDGTEVEVDPDSIAVLLQTSGTSSSPKSAILRHAHMTSYVFGSMDFGSADESDAALVSVPPYHVAGLTNLLSNIYATRRIVYLDNFTASDWLAIARSERVTHAMLVPTMLTRIVDEVEKTGVVDLHSLRAVAYGGAVVSRSVIEKALLLFSDVDFVNAYGLTETSSTIAVLGPEDHRAALASADPDSRARLSSVGRPLPGLEVEIRDDAGSPVPDGVAGELWVRGPQVSGEYVGRAAALDSLGWFETRDRARLDLAGYLFIEGRQDDTIIRGGENIAPAEIEDVLLQHPDVIEAAVVGVLDEQWGHRIVAAVVTRDGQIADSDELKAFVRRILRSSRTPDVIEFWAELPYTDTGKLLRRKVAEAVSASSADTVGRLNGE